MASARRIATRAKAPAQSQRPRMRGGLISESDGGLDLFDFAMSTVRGGPGKRARDRTLPILLTFEKIGLPENCKASMSEPIFFKPIYQERVWGARNLERALGRELPGGQPIGEAWEV